MDAFHSVTFSLGFNSHSSNETSDINDFRNYNSFEETVKDFRVGKLLGEGTHARVYEGINETNSQLVIVF